MQGVKRKRKRNTHSPADIARAAERKQKTWQLKMAGATFRQIGIEVGVAWQTARKYYIERLNEIDPHDPDETNQKRREETARLDGDLLALARARQAGDVPAVRTAVSISARKAAMWGLDAPVKVANTNKEGTEDVQPITADTLRDLKRAEEYIAWKRRKREEASPNPDGDRGSEAGGVDPADGSSG